MAPHVRLRRAILALATVALSIGLIAPAAGPAQAVAGTLSGTVRASDTNGVLEGVYVYLYRKNISETVFVDFTSTAADGTYSFSTAALLDDTYAVEFWPAGLPYSGEYWNNQTSWDNTTLIPITTGANVSSINATLGWFPSITGNVVTDTFSDPVYCADAELIDVHTGSVVGSAMGAGGAYYLSTSGVPAGRYTLRFRDGCDNYAPQYLGDVDLLADATTFYLTPGQVVTGMDASLPLGASIAGTVVGTDVPDASGMSAYVEALSVDTGESFTAITQSDGTYLLDGLPGGNYRVEFNDATCDTEYSAQWWDTSASAGSATTVSPALGGSVTGIDATLTHGAEVTGQVVDSAVGVEGMLVTIFTADGTSYVDECGHLAPRLEADYAPLFGGTDAGPAWNEDEGTWVDTDVNGAFVLPALPPGEYTLHLDGSWLDEPSQFMGGATFIEDADTFTVPDSDPLDLGAISLVAGGSISGHLTFDGTTTIGEYSSVLAFAFNPTTTDWQVVAKGEFGVVGNNLTYTLPDLSAGTYHVGFFDFPTVAGAPGYASEYWDDVLSEGDTTDVVVVGTSDTPGIDAELSALRPVDSVRYAGDDRYLTSVAISQTYAPGVPVLYVAVGSNFPDALAAAPAAAAQGGPLLLVQSNAIPAATLAEIVRLNPALIVVAGGEGVVSASVYNQLATLAPSIRRDAGSDRYATAREIINGYWGPGEAPLVYIATGANFPDALSAAAAAGALGAPVVTINGSANSLSTETIDLLASLGTTRIAIAGGTGVVSPAIETQLAGLPGVTEVWRLAGENRYATGGAINHEAFASTTTAFVSYGLNFPDALSGAALAGFEHAPLYIIPGTCLPQLAISDMNAMGVTTVKILGGTGVVSVNLAHVAKCP